MTTTIDAPPVAALSAADIQAVYGLQSLLIRQIRRDGGTQARIGLNEDTVQEYAELMRDHLWDFQSRQRPIVLSDGTDFWLADGFHRIEAAQRAQLSDFPVEVLRGTKRDAILRAAGANSQHGLRRTNADKRRAVELLLKDEEWRQWSDRKIADVCQVGNKFVGDVRRDLSVSGTQIPETRSVERNGSTYQMTPAAPKPTLMRPNSPDGWVWRDNNSLRRIMSGDIIKPQGSLEATVAAAEQFDRERAAREQARAPEETDDSAIIARIRDEASALGLGVIWEDDTVIVHWPEEDIDQLLGMDYQEALYWLSTEGAQQAEHRQQLREIAQANALPIEPQLAPTLIELDTNRMPDDLLKAGYYWASATPPTIAQNGSAWRGEAPTPDQALQLAITRERQRSESAFPVLSARERKALIGVMHVFIDVGLHHKFPEIGQLLKVAARRASEATE